MMPKTQLNKLIDPFYDIIIGSMLERLKQEPDDVCAQTMDIKSDHRPIEDVLVDVRDYLQARGAEQYVPLVGLGKNPGTIVILLMSIT